MLRKTAACLGLLVLIPGWCNPAAAGTPSEEVAVVTTPHGELTWRFFEQEAPQHTAYMKELIKRGFFDGTTFHRVIPHFVIQGGDPNSKNADRSDDGNGEADRRLKAEFSDRLHYRPGTVGMARDVDPDSASCQFFIALENIPRLDGKYTIFGELIEGMDVARRIADEPRDLNDNPLGRVAVTIKLERRRVPETIYSLESAESTELLSGPSKPRLYDPGNILWKPPACLLPTEAAPASSKKTRIEMAIESDGKPIDVRFPDVDTVDAAALKKFASTWTFTPAAYGGAPARARFEIDSDGKNIGASTSSMAPVEFTTAGVIPPVVAVSIELAAGQKVPAGVTRLRLTIDPGGAVQEAAIQTSCGDATLDARAADAAKLLVFTPATRAPRTGTEPEPVAVYMNIEARFTAAKH